MLEALGVVDAAHLVCCRPPSPRGHDPELVADAACELGVDPGRVEVVDDVAEAVGFALGVDAPGRTGDRHRFAVRRRCGPSRAGPLTSAAMSTRTLVLCKPDAVERGLVGEIIGRLERKGLTITALQLRTIDEELAGRHYEEHRDKPFFGDLVAFITRGPLVAMVVEGGPDTWKTVRQLMGATNPREAAPGTIRGDLALETGENLVHGSDGPDSAEREIQLFFPPL